MLRLIIYFSILPFLTSGQPADSLKQEESSKVFCQAIAEYIKAMDKEYKPAFDTLFIGLYELHHDKKIPAVIQNTNIVLLKSNEEGDKKLEYRKSFNYVNIAEFEVTKDSAQYLFITFLVDKSGGKANWKPKHHCFIDFKYDSKAKAFKLSKQRFEYPYSGK